MPPARRQKRTREDLEALEAVLQECGLAQMQKSEALDPAEMRAPVCARGPVGLRHNSDLKKESKWDICPGGDRQDRVSSSRETGLLSRAEAWVTNIHEAQVGW